MRSIALIIAVCVVGSLGWLARPESAVAQDSSGPTSTDQNSTGQNGASPDAAAQEPKKTYFWLRVWPDFLVKYDVETDRVVQKVKSKNGVSHGTTLSFDKKSFFMITGKRGFVEVLDVTKGEIVEEHSFAENGRIIRVSQIKECPGFTHWYVKIDRVKQELDHYVIEKPEWLYYNVAEKKIEKRMKDLPRAIRRGSRISPCGKKWHIFSRDVSVVNAETLEEEGKIELSTPLYAGMGPISVSSGMDFYDYKDPTAYRMLYTMRDPVRKNRSLGGVIELDMEKFEIRNIEEWGASLRTRGFRVTKDKSIGITTGGFGRGGGRQSDGVDPKVTFLTYSLKDGKKLLETTVDSRNGLRLAAISPDGEKIYMTGRGHELVVYDSQHRYMKTVELDGETDGSIYVLEQ